jgi:hypothetical protein
MYNIDYLKDKFFSRFGNLKYSKEEKDRMFRQFLYEEEMREMQKRQLAESYMGGAKKTTTTTTLPPVFTLLLQDCPGNWYTAYSLSSVFAPGIYIYQNAGLTIPYTAIGLGNDGIGTYTITNGLVGNTFTFCG